VFLVNTCTVRQHAEDRAFSEIGRGSGIGRQAAGRKIVVTVARLSGQGVLGIDFHFWISLSELNHRGLLADGGAAPDRRETDEELGLRHAFGG